MVGATGVYSGQCNLTSLQPLDPCPPSLVLKGSKVCLPR